VSALKTENSPPPLTSPKNVMSHRKPIASTPAAPIPAPMTKTPAAPIAPVAPKPPVAIPTPV